MNDGEIVDETKDVWRTKMNRADKRKRYRLTKKKGKVYASIFTHKMVVDSMGVSRREVQDLPPQPAYYVAQLWKLEKLRRKYERLGLDDHQLLEMS